MSSKKKAAWYSCIYCEHLQKCIEGQNRIKSLTPNSKIAEDIGCFDHEIYLNRLRKQLKLF